MSREENNTSMKKGETDPKRHSESGRPVSIFRPSDKYLDAKKEKEAENKNTARRGRGSKSQGLLNQENATEQVNAISAGPKDKANLEAQNKTGHGRSPEPQRLLNCSTNSLLSTPTGEWSPEKTTAKNYKSREGHYRPHGRPRTGTNTSTSSLGNWISSLLDAIKEFSSMLSKKFTYALDTTDSKVGRNQVGVDMTPRRGRSEKSKEILQNPVPLKELSKKTDETCNSKVSLSDFCPGGSKFKSSYSSERGEHHTFSASVTPRENSVSELVRGFEKLQKRSR